MIGAHAHATVTQVDGTVLPVTNALQNAIDTYETPAGSINALKDAAQVPEIFLPRLSSPVVFLDVREGAGYENSFGWYNVGDDVQTPAGRTANLHPVMGCGIQMVAGAGDATHHSGNPAYYVQNAEEPNTISVDFNSEKTAGRYKGGFIGFYLITPEGHPSAQNCGDFKTGTDGKALFGFIYFTQKDLNNDGDFVHHLVYTSKSTADRFFFGFEDLFRGGDNDFEDMAMRIDGLTPPCVPQAETCDGLDNDCDGLVDAADPDLTGVAVACTCDDVALTCDNGPRFGVCQTGVTACTAGQIVCHGTGTPGTEVCDGVDNNCNNQTDENIPVGAACDGPDADLCPEGNLICQNGMTVCSDNTGNNIETCNNFDDNCNGQTDEGNPGGGASCGSTIGACSPGTTVCQGGGLVCVGGQGPVPETCNGVDDDCNGVVDNSPTDVGMQCGSTNVGECEYGQTICIGGSLQCGGQIGPTSETCNNKDDNCNGTTDDNPVDAGQPCGSSIGVCTPGVYVCTNGGLVCQGGTGPTAEICDGLDNDCNGIIDDDVPGEGVACGGMANCQNGLTKCISGSIQCVGGQTSGTETCNDLDDDCDGMIDEGPLCNGGVCDNGTCAAPCVQSEFPCPVGKKCNPQNFCVDDTCYGVQCPADGDGNAQTCSDGVCHPICDTTTCTGGLVCRPSDGSCVPDTCEYLPKCAANELCVNGTCQADACLGVTCPTDEFCRRGRAASKSCNGVVCDDGQVCAMARALRPAASARCAAPLVCNAGTGQCVERSVLGRPMSDDAGLRPVDGRVRHRCMSGRHVSRRADVSPRSVRRRASEWHAPDRRRWRLRCGRRQRLMAPRARCIDVRDAPSRSIARRVRACHAARGERLRDQRRTASSAKPAMAAWARAAAAAAAATEVAAAASRAIRRKATPSNATAPTTTATAQPTRRSICRTIATTAARAATSCNKAGAQTTCTAGRLRDHRCFPGLLRRQRRHDGPIRKLRRLRVPVLPEQQRRRGLRRHRQQLQRHDRRRVRDAERRQ